MRVGIDIMGGDSSPQELYQAVLDAATHLGVSSELLVLGTQQLVDALQVIPKTKGSATIIFRPVSQSIEMSDSPLTAIRKKKDSSLLTGIRLLKTRELDAFVSAGNTGAIIAGASLMLPKLPGVKKLALMATLPTEKGVVHVLDVGGNVHCGAETLLQFAEVGAAIVKARNPSQIPKVGLLNIGTESQKGTLEHRRAYRLLEEGSNSSISEKQGVFFQFLGNIEGRDIFRGNADLVVTDGFTGNVLLKSAEGVASYIFDILSKKFISDSSHKPPESFLDLQKTFQYTEYPGALICGADALLVKCHGDSCRRSFFNSIIGAAALVEQGAIQRAKELLNLLRDSC